MKKLLVLLLASAMAPMLSAADFSTGKRPTVVLDGHIFDRLDAADDSLSLGMLHKFGMSFVCYEENGVACLARDPRAKRRVWAFIVLSDSSQKELESRSLLTSIDIDCESYMGKATSWETFEDFYGENSKNESSEAMSWNPIRPGSLFDVAGRLVCPQK